MRKANFKSNPGVTTSQANWRHLQFGIDGGRASEWTDCGRPGNALLANTATTRSHLFGVWITLREGVAPGGSNRALGPTDPDAVRYHRAFYVIDRSIPVAHEPGRDHNVWDAVLLRRIIE